MNFDIVLKDNEKLIYKLASKFYGVDKNDLYQAGVLGLLKALKKYKNDGTTKFSSYAYDYIFGEMYLLSTNKNIKISKDILRLYKRICETKYKIAQKLNRIPTNLEISEILGLDINDVNLCMSCGESILSLDSNNEEESNLYDTIKGKDEDIDMKILIKDSLEVLNRDEKEIIKSRYFEDLTQSEVARKLNMTQVMVSRYEKKGINKLRNYIAS